MSRAVFLDRDGVLNRALLRDGRPYPPATLEEFEILPGVRAAAERLRRAGFKLIVVTNQPDVARGTQRRDVVEAMHARLAEQLPIDEIRICYHDDVDQCTCRKPCPGLLLAGDTVELRRSYLIGDRWKDIAAGRAAGCATVLIDRRYAETCHVEPDIRVGSITEAVDWILTRG